MISGVYLGILLFFLGQIFGWFQLNTQLLNDWWKDKPIVSALVLGVPCSMFFWYAWKVTTEATGSVWTSRFIGSATGMILFPILTWTLIGESMFTVKTMVCFSLAIVIILIQLFC